MDDQPPPLSGVREGDVLAGKYRIDKILGAGGMGVVVAAYHLHLDTKVAIKFLLPQALANAQAVARFAREARAAVKIKSEHVARVSDVGTLDNGAPYMVMEYLEGKDLGAWLGKNGPLPVEQAVDFVLQACEAIAEAHALGIVHRDLKPSNLFVVRRPGGSYSVKVLDFGISKAPRGDATGPDLTATSAVMGSPLYMSPEQMQSAKEVDLRTDIWALGVVLYELLAGQSPFFADTMPELIARIITEPPPPLSTKRPDAPPGLEAALVRCLQKDRNARFQTIGDLATALVEFGSADARASVQRIRDVLSEAGMSSRDLPFAQTAPGGAELPHGGTDSSWGRTGTGRTGNQVALVGGAAVLLLVAGGLSVRALVGPEATPGSGSAVPTSTGPVRVDPSTTPPPELAPSRKVIDSEPSGATVFVAGRVAGTTPVSLEVRPTDALDVVLRRDGYEDATRRVQSTDPDQIRITLEAKAPPPPPKSDAPKASAHGPRLKLAPR
jgi:serine/threonine-protein kinase